MALEALIQSSKNALLIPLAACNEVKRKVGVIIFGYFRFPLEITLLLFFFYFSSLTTTTAPGTSTDIEEKSSESSSAVSIAANKGNQAMMVEYNFWVKYQF